jgi:NAD(P)-dependent dehydrogenase (short-subunit alcohol dehydrogenase family)
LRERFAEKVVAITGSGSGMGLETARIIASEGGKVVVSGINKHRVEAAAALIESEGGTCVGVTADVTRAEDMDRLVAAAVRTYGRLDAMHANAGIVEEIETGTPVYQRTAEEWDRVFAVNARGVFFTFRAAVAQFVKQGPGGVLLATTSAAGTFFYGAGIYAASKSAANGIVRSFAVECGPLGIRANAVAPFHGMSANFVLPPDAEVLGQSYEELWPWSPSGNPPAMPLALPTPPTLRDNANLAAFLLSDEARYISGEVFHSASGGTSARVAINFETAAPNGLIPPELQQRLADSSP